MKYAFDRPRVDRRRRAPDAGQLAARLGKPRLPNAGSCLVGVHVHCCGRHCDSAGEPEPRGRSRRSSAEETPSQPRLAGCCQAGRSPSSDPLRSVHARVRLDGDQGGQRLLGSPGCVEQPVGGVLTPGFADSVLASSAGSPRSSAQCTATRCRGTSAKLAEHPKVGWSARERARRHEHRYGATSRSCLAIDLLCRLRGGGRDVHPAMFTAMFTPRARRASDSRRCAELHCQPDSPVTAVLPVGTGASLTRNEISRSLRWALADGSCT